MIQITTATFENGVFKPDDRLNLAQGAKVRLVITPSGDAAIDHKLAFDQLEQFRAQHPIDSKGQRLTRDELHERR
jgi:predicted DNA-binding antitoxin AbrB/MazE fold protein